MLNETERTVLSNFVATTGALNDALRKFAEHRRIEMEKNAADSLRSVPREVEQACDYAAKAEVYGTLLIDLARFAANS